MAPLGAFHAETGRGMAAPAALLQPGVDPIPALVGQGCRHISSFSPYCRCKGLSQVRIQTWLSRLRVDAVLGREWQRPQLCCSRVWIRFWRSLDRSYSAKSRDDSTTGTWSSFPSRTPIAWLEVPGMRTHPIAWLGAPGMRTHPVC